MVRIRMIIFMRTTLIIDDHLLQQARQRAAETDQTVSDIINAALRQALQPAPPLPVQPFRMPTFGGVAPQDHQPSDFTQALERDDIDQMLRRVRRSC